MYTYIAIQPQSRVRLGMYMYAGIHLSIHSCFVFLQCSWNSCIGYIYTYHINIYSLYIQSTYRCMCLCIFMCFRVYIYIYMYVCILAILMVGLATKWYLTLATSGTVARQVSLSMGFPRQEMEWVAISSFTGFSWPRGGTWVSCIAGRFFATEPPPNSCNDIKHLPQGVCEWKIKLRSIDLANHSWDVWHSFLLYLKSRSQNMKIFR